jgi:hypothetical protein
MLLVVKRGDRAPSLDKEGRQRPEAAAGWFESSWKSQTSGGVSVTHTTPHGAQRHVPSSSEEGSFSAMLEFRDRN